VGDRGLGKRWHDTISSCASAKGNTWVFFSGKKHCPMGNNQKSK